MNKTTHQEEYKVFQENNQLVLILNSEILLPENDPVRVTSAQLEELDYRKLYEAYSSRGRKSVNDPRVLFKVMAYGYQCGIFSSRKLEEACKYRVDFMWLLETGRHRITLPFPGSARDGAPRPWRICSTSMSSFWRSRAR